MPAGPRPRIHSIEACSFGPTLPYFTSATIPASTTTPIAILAQPGRPFFFACSSAVVIVALMCGSAGGLLLVQRPVVVDVAVFSGLHRRLHLLLLVGGRELRDEIERAAVLLREIAREPLEDRRDLDRIAVDDE